MSVLKVAIVRCDTCGADLAVDRSDVTTARIDASRKGWKFMSYTNFVVGGKNRGRFWDCCPACDLPEPETVLQALKAELENA